MAQATYKMESGEHGGYVAYVQVVSPLLKEKSGQWFVVTPDNNPTTPGAKPHEYPNLWMAEQAARDTALRLAGKVTDMENAGKPASTASVDPKPSDHR